MIPWLVDVGFHLLDTQKETFFKMIFILICYFYFEIKILHV